MKDAYGRNVLCKECCMGNDAKYCKYCISGQCEADQPKKTERLVNPNHYVFYGGIPYLRNNYRGM